MPAWLNAILGRVSGKTSRLDTATRMAMDADFSDRQPSTPAGPSRGHQRDDKHLFKSPDPLADINLLEQLVSIINEAQERDAKRRTPTI